MAGFDWAVVFATLASPVLAVQAQKWIERARERRQRKLWVFGTLMTTRGVRVSADHVRALNSIDTVFDGGTVVGIRHGWALRYGSSAARRGSSSCCS